VKPFAVCRDYRPPPTPKLTAQFDPFETFMPPPAAGRVARKRSFASHFWSCWRTGSSQFGEQRLRLFQNRRIEALCEPAVDRRQETAGFGAAALVAAESGKARGGAQFPKLGFLLLGNAQGFAIQSLRGLGMSLVQQQLTFLSMQLRGEPALPCPPY
jgi:hypothetical protein